VPINPGYVFFHDKEKVVFRNFEGKVFEYPEVQEPEQEQEEGVIRAARHEEAFIS
jgi:lysine 2,3-aminomutase